MGLREVLHSKWLVFEFLSPDPLLGEQTMRENGPFSYPVYFRVCERFADVFLLSYGATVVTALLASEGLRGLCRSRLVQRHVDVDRLVRILVEHRREYALTAVYASVSGWGNSITRADYFGDDLTNADYFKHSLPNLNIRSCGLRRLGPAECPDVRLGLRGQIWVGGTHPRYLKELESTFFFVRRTGLVMDT